MKKRKKKKKRTHNVTFMSSQVVRIEKTSSSAMPQIDLSLLHFLFGWLVLNCFCSWSCSFWVVLTYTINQQSLNPAGKINALQCIHKQQVTHKSLLSSFWLHNNHCTACMIHAIIAYRSQKESMKGCKHFMAASDQQKQLQQSTTAADRQENREENF